MNQQDFRYLRCSLGEFAPRYFVMKRYDLLYLVQCFVGKGKSMNERFKGTISPPFQWDLAAILRGSDEGRLGRKKYFTSLIPSHAQ